MPTCPCTYLLLGGLLPCTAVQVPHLVTVACVHSVLTKQGHAASDMSAQALVSFLGRAAAGVSSGLMRHGAGALRHLVSAAAHLQLVLDIMHAQVLTPRPFTCG